MACVQALPCTLMATGVPLVAPRRQDPGVYRLAFRQPVGAHSKPLVRHAWQRPLRNLTKKKERIKLGRNALATEAAGHQLGLG